MLMFGFLDGAVVSLAQEIRDGRAEIEKGVSSRYVALRRHTLPPRSRSFPYLHASGQTAQWLISLVLVCVFLPVSRRLVIVCSGGRVFMDKALPALGDSGGGYRYVLVLCSSS